MENESIKINPIQRIAVGAVVASYEAAPSQLKVIKDIYEKLDVDNAHPLVEQNDRFIKIKDGITDDELKKDLRLSRAEKEVLSSILAGRKFTLHDFDWVIPILDYLKQ